MFQFGEYLEKVELYEKVMDEIERIVHDKGKMTLYGFKTAGAAMKAKREDEKPLPIFSAMKMGQKIITNKSGRKLSIRPLANKDMVNVYDDRGRIILYNVYDYEF